MNSPLSSSYFCSNFTSIQDHLDPRRSEKVGASLVSAWLGFLSGILDCEKISPICGVV